MSQQQEGTSRPRRDSRVVAKIKYATADMDALYPSRKRYRDAAAGGKTRFCGMRSFYATYASEWKLPEAEVEAIERRATKIGVINRYKQWAQMPKPKRRTLEGGAKIFLIKEDNHFRKMESVVESILEIAEELYPDRFSREKRTTRFMCRPTKTTSSEVEGSSYRADALFARVHSSYPSAVTEKTAGTVGNSSVKLQDEVILTADVTCTGEGKLELGTDQIVDNEMKVLGQAGHMFHNDVGRTAVWTFTIENSQMRMWYHSRSHTGVTEPFDMYKHDWFIHFVLFNTYASLTTLGIDPTVKRVMDKAGNMQYQFDIYRPGDPTPRVYETTRLLDERSAKTFYTRAMRVFAVRRVEKNTADPSERLYSAETQVLRDYWVYDDVPDESDIQEAIKDEMKKHADIWPDAEKHMIGIEEDGVVHYPNVGTPEKGKGPGYVPAPPMGAERYDFKSEENPEGSKPRRAQIKVATTVRTPDSDNTPRPAPKALADELLRLHGKKHCRTIYSQICIDLYAVDDPALFFHALSQISKILRYLKGAGYLHRDVSPGNFLLYRKASDGASGSEQRRLVLDEWVAFITDLEYARPYTGGTGHDPITGTSHYIAVEVQRQTHLFLPEIFGDVLQGAESFAFNFYHDLESVIWMALDFAFCKISKTLL
ncbi:hypothetical protein EV715DRAFT_195940, partial [Schizophyllum commune]